MSFKTEITMDKKQLEVTEDLDRQDQELIRRVEEEMAIEEAVPVERRRAIERVRPEDYPDGVMKQMISYANYLSRSTQHITFLTAISADGFDYEMESEVHSVRYIQCFVMDLLIKAKDLRK